MNLKDTYNLAIVGATGAVGQTILKILEDRKFPINKLTLLSSSRSAGKELSFKNEKIIVEEASSESFNDVDIALFSAGGSISEEFASSAVERGAVVVDNTSAFRMHKDVPLIVPEVNPDEIKKHKGIIANPNCSTIQMVAALKPIQAAYGINRIIVSTYQAVSGAGNEANEELTTLTRNYIDGKELKPELLPVKSEKKHYPIAFNALPQIDVFDKDTGYTKEELKMINETKKIMQDPSLAVAATCVRLPIFTSHAESIYIEVNDENITVTDIQNTLKHVEGIVLEDDLENQDYPTPLTAADKDDVFVGRVRKDLDNSKGFHLWVVADNLRKGAALNTVQIAEHLIKNNESE